MLLKIREFIQDQSVVSLPQLMQHFQIEASALEPMLELLLEHQDIQEYHPDVCQVACQGCESPKYYQWIKT